MVKNETFKLLEQYQDLQSKITIVKTNFEKNETVIKFSKLNQLFKKLKSDIEKNNAEAEKNITALDELKDKENEIVGEIDELKKNDFSKLSSQELDYYVKKLEQYRITLESITADTARIKKTLDSISKQANEDIANYNKVYQEIKNIQEDTMKIQKAAKTEMAEYVAEQKKLAENIDKDLLAYTNKYFVEHPKTPNVLVKFNMDGATCGGCGMGGDKNTLMKKIEMQGYFICEECGRINYYCNEV